MEMCCYGCGNPGIYEFKSTQSKYFGQKRCSEKYRSCPVKAAECGEKRKGKKHSEEAKRKIGEKSKGRTSVFKGKTSLDDPRIASGANHPNFGKSVNDEVKKKISKTKTGISLSDKHRIAISESLVGEKNPMFGRRHSLESKQKIRDTIITNKICAGQNNPNYNPLLDRSGIRVYRSLVMSLTRKTYEAFKDEINPGNLDIVVSGQTGYQIDHIVPISIGFKYKIPPQIMASKINLQLLTWDQNIKKGNKMTDEAKLLLEQFISLGAL